MPNYKLKTLDEIFGNKNKSQKESNIIIKDSTECNEPINLFDFIPFNEKNINKISVLINKKNLENERESSKRSFQLHTNNFLNKEMFYVKNDNDKTFIETLLEMDKPSSYEEIHVRVYLLSYFFDRGLDNIKNNAIRHYDEKNTIFMEQVAKVTEKYYDDFCSIKNFIPKKSLKDYVNQLEEIVSKNKPLAEIKAELKEVLEEFYIPFNNTQITHAKELITPMVLTAKIALTSTNKTALLRELTAQLYFETIPKEYQYEENRQLLIQIGSSLLPDFLKGRFFLPEKEGSTLFQEQGLIDHLSLTVLTDLVAEMLLNNKIMMSYETLNAELSSNVEVKIKKPKL